MAHPRVSVPDHIRQAVDEYGFQDSQILNRVVARRFHNNWCAILVEENHQFYAIDFCRAAGKWEVQNDYIGPFETVQAFEDAKLCSTFF